MITVRMERPRGDLRVIAEASGHSGMAAAGNDIVCAAVSVLMDVLARIWTKQGTVKEIAQSDGYMKIEAEGSRAIMAAAAVAGELREIEKAYPEHLKMKEFL